MTELAIDVQEWANTLGPAIVVKAYVTLENERRLEEWSDLLAEGATYTAAFDGKTPTTVDLRERIKGVVGKKSHDLHIDIKWLTAVNRTTAVFEVGVDGTTESMGAYRLDAVVKFELDDRNRLEKVSAYYFQPAVAAELVRGL